jgi:uncharacterized protein YjiS (DUF1127 family)
LCASHQPREVSIRIFGVSLLAVAAVAAASLLWRRRQEELVALVEADDHRLDDLRVAGL